MTESSQPSHAPLLVEVRYFVAPRDDWQLLLPRARQHGTPWHDAGSLPHPSALHPAFLAAARDWIAAFSAAIRVLQAPHGPIVALHAGATSTPDRLDYNQAATAHPSAPDLQAEPPGA